jgi:hypothetical protein
VTVTVPFLIVDSQCLDAAFPEKGCSSLHLGKINLEK